MLGCSMRSYNRRRGDAESKNIDSEFSASLRLCGYKKTSWIYIPLLNFETAPYGRLLTL